MSSLNTGTPHSRRVRAAQANRRHCRARGKEASKRKARRARAGSANGCARRRAGPPI